MASPGTVSDQIVIDLITRSTNFIQGIDRAGAAMNRFLGFIFSWRGAVIGALGVLGIALVKVGRASVAMAATLDASLREVATLIPQTAGQIDNLRKQLIQLSTRVPQPPELLARGLYQVVSAGITDTAQAFRVLETAAKAAVAGLTDTFTSVDAITTVLNAFQLEADAAGRVSDVFFATVQEGKITFDQLASTIGDVATTAALTGVSIEEVGAAIATLTKFGISAEESTTALNRALLAVVQATDDEKKAAASLGFEFDVTALQAKGLSGFMQDLNQATDGQVKALSAVFPEIRAFRAVSVLAGQGQKEFGRILGVTNNAAGLAGQAYEEMEGKLDSLQKLAGQRVNALFREFGSKILPSITGALGAFLDATEQQVDAELRLLDALGRTNDALELRRLLAGDALTGQLDDLINSLKDTAEEFKVLDGIINFDVPRSSHSGLTLSGEGIASASFEGAIPAFEELRVLSGLLNEELEAGNTDIRDMALLMQRTGDELRSIVGDEELLKSIVEETLKGIDGQGASHDQIVEAVQLLTVEELKYSQVIGRVLRTLDLIDATETSRQLNSNERLAKIQRERRQNEELLRLKRQLGNASDDELKGLTDTIRLEKQREAIIEKSLDAAAILLRTSDETLGITSRQRRVLNEVLNPLKLGLKITEDQADAVGDWADRIEATIDGYVAQRAVINESGQAFTIDNILKITGLKRQEKEASSLLNVLRLVVAAFAGPREEINLPGDTDKSLEAAKERLEDLRVELETLGRFGFTILGDAPTDLRRIIRDVQGVDREIKELSEDLKLTGNNSEEFVDQLARLQDRREELLAQGDKLAVTPEGLIADDARDAADEVEKLQARRAVLGRLGFDVGDFIPEEFMDIIDELGDLGIRIKEVTEDQDKLAEAAVELRERAATLNELGLTPLADSATKLAEKYEKLVAFSKEYTDELKRQQGVANDAAAAQREFGEAFRTLTDLTGDAIVKLGQEFGDAFETFFKAQVEGFATLTERVAQAQATLDDLASESTTRSETLARAQKKLKAAHDQLNKATRQLRLELGRMGLTAEEAQRVMALLGATLIDASNDSKDLVKNLRQLEGLARGVLGVADAFFELDDAVRQALTGVIDIASGIGQIASGNLLSGVAELAGGAAGVIAGIAGLFGESPEDKARREAVQANTAALDNLSKSLSRQEQLVASLTGNQIAELVALGKTKTFQETATQISGDFAFGPQFRFKETVKRRLDLLGITVEDIEAIVSATEDFDATNLINFLNGLPADIESARQEFDKLVELGREAVGTFLTTLIDEFDEKQALLSQRQRLFGDEFEAEPTRFIKTFQKNLADALGGEVGAQLAAFDLDTPEGRKAALAFVQDLFERGLVDPSVLGQFTPGEFRDAVVDFGVAVKDFEESDAGTVSTGGPVSTISEVTGNRIVGSLTTISVIEQLQLSVLKEILITMGGEVPENVQTISFRAPGTEFDILQIEEKQLLVLEAILVELGGAIPGSTEGTLRPPTEAELAALEPNVFTVPAGQPQVVLNFGANAVVISTTTLTDPQAVEDFADQIAPAINQRLGVLRTRARRSRGRIGGLQ